MASGGSNENDIFECAVCLNQMLDRTPRCLQCIHSFCEPCLEQMMRKSRITCPTCRKTTMVPTNCVKELPVNFMLHKMKDLQKAQKPQQQGHPKMRCQICKVATPDFKCNSCPRLMCAACKNEHNDVKEYKGHSVFDLCHQHEDSITHMCMKCITPLCMSCMAIDHKHHKGNFEDMSEAMKNMMNDADKLKNTLREKEIELVHFDENIQQQAKNNSDTEKELLERQKYHAEKMKEIGELLKTTSKNKETLKNLEEGCVRTRNACEELAASLETSIRDKEGFCYKYSQLKEKAEDAVNKKIMVEYVIQIIELNEHIDMELVKSTEQADVNTILKQCDKKPLFGKFTKVRDIKLSKLLFDIPWSDFMRCSEQIDFIGSGVVMPNDSVPYHVIQLNQQGREVKKYYPSLKKERINGVAVNEYNIYIVQNKAITVISSINKRTIAVYKPHIDQNMGKIYVENKSVLYITPYNYDPGSVYRYNTESDKIQVLVENLHKPTHISKVNTEEGPKFIVTEQKGHCIRVYDDKWRLLQKIGSQGSGNGQLYFPDATAVTQMGTLLLADNSNWRICHYTVCGQFLSTVISKQDMKGGAPAGIAYRHPILWVSTTGGKINCFQLSY